MGSLFSLDGGLFTFLGKLCDMLIVSLLWLICCIPIITIGLSTTSLYYATVKVIRRERGYLTREFLHCMKTNLKQGLIVGGILAVITCLLLFNLLFTNAQVTPLFQILHNVYLVFIVIAVAIMFYIYPLLSRFEMKVGRYFTFSLYLILRHLPTTIACGALFAVAVVGVLIMPVAIIVAPGFCCFVISFLMEKVLKKYTPGVEPDIENTEEKEELESDVYSDTEAIAEISNEEDRKEEDRKEDDTKEITDKWYLE